MLNKIKELYAIAAEFQQQHAHVAHNLESMRADLQAQLDKYTDMRGLVLSAAMANDASAINN